MAYKSLGVLLFVCGCAPVSVDVRLPRESPPVVVHVQPDNGPPMSDGPASLPPPTHPTPAQSEFVLSFDPGSAVITPDMGAAIAEAAETYWETGNVTIAIVEADAAAPQAALYLAVWQGGGPSLLEQRVRAAQLSLIAWRVWSRPVVKGPGGAWVEWSPGQPGPVFLLLGPRPEPPVPVQPPPRGPAGVAGDEPGRDRTTPHQAGDASVRAGSSGAPPPTPQVWLEDTGTLLSEPLEFLLEECRRLQGRVTVECGAAARARAGGFARVPDDAIAEFVFLLRQCAGMEPNQECVAQVRLEREYRALNRGRLDPSPLQMTQGGRTLFTAFIRYDPSIRGQPGVQIGEGEPSGGGVSGQTPAGTVIPISHRMCFSLTAEREGAFEIEPKTEACMTMRSGGRILFNPQWWVTPRQSGRHGLLLVTELYVNGQKRDYPHDPTPLFIDVGGVPGLWDKIDGFLERLTATFNRATGLAKAIGAFIAAVGAWGIWSFFRRRRRRRSGAQEAPRPPKRSRLARRGGKSKAPA